MKVELKILNKDLYTENNLPKAATAGSAAVDLLCPETLKITSGETVKINSGISIWIDSYTLHAEGFGTRTKDGKYFMRHGISGMIIPRSGLGSKGIVIANTVGLIDGDYQGELIINLHNRNSPSEKPITIKKKDKFAQLFLTPVIVPEWNVVGEFSRTTDRGSDGFGSTGK